VKARELGVWLGGSRISTFRSNRPGRVECRYSEYALDAWEGNTPVLSYSLPVSSKKLEAFPFVTGLLPEGQHRQEMASRAKVATTDVLGMLERFGRDVAGALVISADDPPVRNPSVKRYSAEELTQAVADLSDAHPLGLHDDSELSIAGLADKMLVVALGDGEYGRPVHGAPSTHILKVDDRVRRGLVRAEHACLLLARHAGLRAAGSDLIQVGDAECIVAERFDRVEDAETGTIRVHQEDSCQALRIDPERNDRKGKYQASGGPSFAGVAGVLNDWAEDVEVELAALLDAMVFTVAIGNADAHGKNVALLHPRPGVIKLAPLYDTVPTVMWPSLRTEAGMFVNSVTNLRRVRLDDLVSEAAGWGLSRQSASGRALDVLGRLRDALSEGAVDVDTPALATTKLRVEALLADS
jgi:serine/threonine-protein kinase HipA